MAEDTSKATRQKPLIQKVLGKRISLSRLYITFERAARVFWPVWTLAFLGYVLWAFDVFGELPVVWSRSIFGALLVAMAVFFVVGIMRFRLPSRAEGVARLDEVTDGFVVSALEDRQATGLSDPQAGALWERHQEMMAERARQVEVPPPDLRLSDRDPWALRLAGVVAVIAALIFARGEGLPDASLLAEPDELLASGPSFEAWATPPAYTGKPVIYLSQDTSGKRFDLPEGSEIMIRIYGEASDFSLVDGLSGTGATLGQTAPGIAESRFEVAQSGDLTLSRGGTELAAWSFTLLPDNPPTIRLDGTFVADHRRCHGAEIQRLR